jgi:lysozyme
MVRLYTVEQHAAFVECQGLMVSESAGGLMAKLAAAAKRVKKLPKAIRTSILYGLIVSALAYTQADRLGQIISTIADSDLFSAWNKVSKRNSRYKDIEDLGVSSKGIDLIKSHEQLKLRGYDIGDGMITIGWGHAERKGRSKYKVGQAITKRQADRLFDQDIKTVESAIKRRLKAWRDDGHDVPLSQEMYDALVSVAFNKGAAGLFSTKFMKHLKKGDYEAAGKAIEHEYNQRRVRKFGGIVKRRKDESLLFLSGL